MQDEIVVVKQCITMALSNSNEIVKMAMQQVAKNYNPVTQVFILLMIF